MHFLLGFLLGYYTRNKPLLAATLTIIALICFIVLPAIALSGLALSVRRERLSRPPQTRVPPLIGLDYKTAETTLHNSKLNIRVLAHRYDPPTEPGKILFQTPQPGEPVDCGTVVGIVVSKEDPDNKNHDPERVNKVNGNGDAAGMFLWSNDRIIFDTSDSSLNRALAMKSFAAILTQGITDIQR